MSGRKNFLKYASIVAGDMSDDIESVVTNIEHLDNIAFHFVWAGTSPVGTIQIQVSNDYDPRDPDAASWVSLAVSPAISVSGNSGSAFVDLNQMGAAYIRAFYDRASGIGALNATLTAKML